MQKKKKGFTLVELLVVIAILAILASVSVVGYLSFTKKAQESNDISLTKQLNTILQTKEALEGKNQTCHDAVVELQENGIDINKLKIYTDTAELFWDSASNRFFVVSGDNVLTGPENVKFNENKEEVFRFIGNGDTLDSIYSNYLLDNYSSSEVLNINSGLDQGLHSNINTVNYKGSAKSRNIIIRSNDGIIRINGAMDNVYHFGTASEILVEKVAMTSYHEFGSVNGNIKLSEGSVVLEKGSKADNLLVTKLESLDGETINPKVDTIKVNNLEKNIRVIDSENVLNEKNCNVESIDTNLVKTADELMNAAKNHNTIVLGDNITINEILINSKMNINLNGYTLNTKIKLNSSANVELTGNGLINSNDDALTIEKGSKLIASNIKVVSTYTSFNNLGGNLVLNNCFATANDFGAIHSESSGTTTVNGGTYECLDNYVIGTHGSNAGNNTIKINDGVFNGYIKTKNYVACGIYLANNDNLRVNGGTFNIYNGVGILVRSGHAIIGKNVIINHVGDNSISSGKVGDSTTSLIEIKSDIVRDELAKYPGGVPTVINYSKYKVIDIIK